MVDPGDWIPVVGVGLLAITTLGSIVGAYAVGRARRREQAAMPAPDASERARIERIEHMLETMSEEMERLGEAQRFLVKVMGDRPLPRGSDQPKSPPRVITPH